MRGCMRDLIMRYTALLPRFEDENDEDSEANIDVEL